MPVGPRGEALPYYDEQPAVQRRRAGGRPAKRNIGKLGPIAGAQSALHAPAQVGPEWPGANPMGLGAYGALGSVPGVGMSGAVDPRAVMNTPRRRLV
jgi:hypothetical protein